MRWKDPRSLWQRMLDASQTSILLSVLGNQTPLFKLCLAKITFPTSLTSRSWALSGSVAWVGKETGSAKRSSSLSFLMPNRQRHWQKLHLRPWDDQQEKSHQLRVVKQKKRRLNSSRFLRKHHTCPGLPISLLLSTLNNVFKKHYLNHYFGDFAGRIIFPFTHYIGTLPILWEPKSTPKINSHTANK